MDDPAPALTEPLHVERVPVASLFPHPRNPREGDVGAIAASLSHHGQYRPIVVQRATPGGEPRNLILAGNHTWKAALALGWPTIDAVFVTVSDEQAVAILLADNRTHDLGRDDPSALFALLRDIDSSVGLEGTAWDRDDLDQLLRDLERDGEDPLGRKYRETDPDEYVEPIPDPYVKVGDIYRLGQHRLMCGDATDRASVTALLAGARPSLIATDPPYGVDYSGIVKGRTNQRKGGWRDMENDLSGADAPVVAGGAFSAVREHAAEHCAILVWHPTGRLQQAFRVALEGAGVHILKQLVWVKPTLIFGRPEYHWRHETAFYGWFEGSRADFLGDRSETTVWEVDYGPGWRVRNGPAMATGGLGLHPTQKPVELTARAIRNHTRVSDAIYEPFNGSGSALIAAEQEGRVCYAMELDPRYAQAAIGRWEKLTGQTASKEDPE